MTRPSAMPKEPVLDWNAHVVAEGERELRDFVLPLLLAIPEMTPGEMVESALRIISDSRSSPCYLCRRNPPAEDGVAEDAWREAVDRHRLAHQGVRGLVLGLARLSQGHPVGRLRPGAPTRQGSR